MLPYKHTAPNHDTSNASPNGAAINAASSIAAAEAILDGMACGNSECQCYFSRDIENPGHGTTHCPVESHPDNSPSFAVDVGDTGKLLFYCRMCPQERYLDALTAHGLWPPAIPNRNGRVAPNEDHGVPLPVYASYVGLTVGELKQWGLKEYMGSDKWPYLWIPYFNENGDQVATRMRFSFNPNRSDRFKWKKDSKVVLYGLDRLSDFRNLGYVTLVEGESDSHVLWSLGEPALGVPGSKILNPDRDTAPLEGFETIYLINEGDRGAEGLFSQLEKFSQEIRDRAKVMNLTPYKDPRELFLAVGRDRFPEEWGKYQTAANPYGEIVAQANNAERAELRERAADIITAPNILERFRQELKLQGFVGEERNTSLIYLAYTSRLFPVPISFGIKGQSSSGKSHTEKSVRAFFPEEAFEPVTRLTLSGLMRLGADALTNKYLVLGEAPALDNEALNSVIRQLLSEGKVSTRLSIPDGKNGWRSVLLEIYGPTGLATTTTLLTMDEENETRMMSLVSDESPNQTGDVLRMLALSFAGAQVPKADITKWRDFQRWLELSAAPVLVPFAPAVASLMPTFATRLRRDISLVFRLIQVHALLHQESRERSSGGSVLASLDDYAAVRELANEPLSIGVGAAVDDRVQAVVDAVAYLTSYDKAQGMVVMKHGELPAVTVTNEQVTAHLKGDDSTTSRWVREAQRLGYLINDTIRPRQPNQWRIGNPLREERVAVLPTVEHVRAKLEEG